MVIYNRFVVQNHIKSEQSEKQSICISNQKRNHPLPKKRRRDAYLYFRENLAATSYGITLNMHIAYAHVCWQNCWTIIRSQRFYLETVFSMHVYLLFSHLWIKKTDSFQFNLCRVPTASAEQWLIYVYFAPNSHQVPGNTLQYIAR